MRTALGNCGCFILSILLLPLFLIFVGPLLVLAALRGRQPLGPIMLNTARYGTFGRIGALLLGLAVWILVWSGLAWILVNGLLPAATVAYAPPETPTATALAADPAASQAEPSVPPSSTFTVVPTPTQLPPSATPTQPPPSTTPTHTPITPATSTPLPEPSATPVLTGTPIITIPPPGDQLLVTTTTEVTRTRPLSLADRQAVIATVEEGNLLLRAAVSLANQENIRKLEEIWQGRALEKAQAFATELYGRYAKPFDVQFEYIVAPTLSPESSLEQAVVISQEAWAYQGRTGVDSESFEFTYTLSNEAGRWVIIMYSYLNLPTPTPVPTATATQTAP